MIIALGCLSVSDIFAQINLQNEQESYAPMDETVADSSANAYQQVETAICRPGEVATIAVILPFNLASRTVSQDKSQMRSVEFYQGLLLAVNEAQKNGQRIELQAYDLGTRSMEDILTDESLLRAHVIFAPMDTVQVRQVAVFGESHGIPVMSPFVFGKNLVEEFPRLFQSNTPKAYLYDQLSEVLMSQFRNFQFVFVKDSLFQDQVDPYPVHLQSALENNEISYYTYIYNDPYSVVCMDSALQLSNKHVLYILETQQPDALRRFFPSLKNKLFLDANPAIAEAIGASYASGENSVDQTVTVEESLPDSLYADSVQLITEERQVAILGYPEWQQQKYTDDFMEYFYDLNVWMFTKFYVNPFDFEVQGFYNDFKFWYNREQMPKIFPKYGMLGYDMGAYVLNQLQLYSTLVGDNPREAASYTLQSAVRFEKEGNGGYLNKGLYLVHFTPETTIEKILVR